MKTRLYIENEAASLQVTFAFNKHCINIYKTINYSHLFLASLGQDWI